MLLEQLGLLFTIKDNSKHENGTFDVSSHISLRNARWFLRNSTLMSSRFTQKRKYQEQNEFSNFIHKFGNYSVFASYHEMLVGRRNNNIHSIKQLLLSCNCYRYCIYRIKGITICYRDLRYFLNKPINLNCRIFSII